MTLQEFSSEKVHFSTPFTDSEEGYSTDLTLETHLALSFWSKPQPQSGLTAE